MEEQELANFEKQLQFIEAEHHKYKERIDQVSNPQYLQELKERIVTLNHKEKRLEKRRKSMETAQKKKDTAIIKKEEEEPEITQAVNALTKESVSLDDKLNECEAKIQKYVLAIQDQTAKLNEAQLHIKKLSDEGSALSINVKDVLDHEKDHKPASKHTDKFTELELKKTGLEKTLTLLKTRYSVTLGEYNQKKHQLQNEVNELSLNLHKKNEYLQ